MFHESLGYDAIIISGDSVGTKEITYDLGVTYTLLGGGWL